MQPLMQKKHKKYPNPTPNPTPSTTLETCMARIQYNPKVLAHFLTASVGSTENLERIYAAPLQLKKSM